jgi:hypothetical protein
MGARLNAYWGGRMGVYTYTDTTRPFILLYPQIRAMYVHLFNFSYLPVHYFLMYVVYGKGKVVPVLN